MIAFEHSTEDVFFRTNQKISGERFIRSTAKKVLKFRVSSNKTDGVTSQDWLAKNQQLKTKEKR